MAAWFIAGCPLWPGEKCPLFRPTKPAAQKVVLTFTGVYDSQKNWAEIISRFQDYKKRPENGFLDVVIRYEEIKDTVNYEDIIFKRQFEDKSPHIFMIFNTWLPRYQHRLIPMPKGMMSAGEFESAFARVARGDLISDDGEIYALPFYIDTLALYYNEQMFFNEKLTKPPENWDEFRDYAAKLRALDKDTGKIEVAGAAFGGGSGNINRNQDILMLLVMQYNAVYGDKLPNLASFNTNSQAANAVKFYTDFTDSSKAFYTWNEDQIFSIDAFTNRKAAMMINYSHHIENVLNKTTGTLDFRIAPIPQISENKQINYANYWVPAVSRKSPPCAAAKDSKVDCYTLAWEFLNFAAKKENVKLYLKAANKPAANLELAREQYEDESNVISSFAGQVFTAVSWKHPDTVASDKALADMIDSIIIRDPSKKSAIAEAIAAIRQKRGLEALY